MVRKLAPMLVLVACGGAALPPPELTSARTAYGQATNGPASQYAPEQVLAARDALDRAEASWKKHGNSEDTRTLAYVAKQKAEIARSAGRAAQQEHNIQDAARELGTVEADQLKRGTRLPRDTNEALAFTESELQRERMAQTQTERQSEERVDDLRHVAHVRRTPTGFIVTLSAPENFADGDDSTTLDDAAASRLDAIAVAIERSAPGAPVVVESRADTANRGDAHDQFVAQKRADVVAAYLATHGVARERIKAVGLPPHHYAKSSPEYYTHGLERRIEILVGGR
jgi:outer membrane protein OmpA-like peptidoglycan-associated protein